MVTKEDIALKSVEYPKIGLPEKESTLAGKVYADRLSKALRMMRENSYKHLLVYADREHYSNFEYLVGFDPRFEEALLLLSADGDATVFLGNECLSLAAASKIPAKGVLYQALSLPFQPIDRLKNLEELLLDAGLREHEKIGVVGWKLMYPRYADRRTFDVPAFIADAVKRVAGERFVENATDHFVHPEYGIRILNTADDIAYYEFGAAWASEALKSMLEALRIGESEIEIARELKLGGLPQNSHPLITVGERLQLGLVTPSNAELKLGGGFNGSVGLRGGLSCRTGYLAHSAGDLPEQSRDYFDVLVAPYFAAVANWYEQMKIGTKGRQIYDMIQGQLPKEVYGWVLNPGHLVSTEEWVSSPFFPGSDVAVRSGMCIQMDIIPNLGPKYAGANCEDGVAIADEALRAELKERFPAAYQRMELRRRHMIEQLRIRLPEEVLPLSNLASTYRPYMLNRELAVAANR